MKIGYARVSTGSGEQLSALEAQRYRIQAEQPDLLLQDVESGLSTGRPEYQKLKSLIIANRVVEVVATRLDRLGRDSTESDSFVKLCDQKKVICRTLDDGIVSMATAEMLLMTRLRGSLAEGESMRLSARILKGLSVGRELGKPMRKPCFGYQLSQDRLKLEPHPVNWPTAAAFIKLLKEHNWRMATALNLTRTPIPISSRKGVRAWLINPTLRGALAYGQLPNHQYSEIIWNQHPALLSPEDYNEMETIITANKKLWGVNSSRKVRALTSLCRCTECNHILNYVPDRTHPALRCQGGKCSRKYRSTRELVILAYVVEQLSSQAAFRLAGAVDFSEPPEVAALRLQIKVLEDQSDPDLAEAIARKIQRLKSLLIQPVVDPDLVQKISDPRWFDSLSYAELTSVLQLLVAQVQLTNGLPVAIDLKL